MMLRSVIAGALALLVATSAYATTLKFPSDIDLLVLDGRKIPGSLLKGAEGLELEQGQHQVLFRVEKNLKKDEQIATPWVSTPLIVTFTTQAKSVTITLPTLLTLDQGKTFDSHPKFQLLDEHGADVKSQQDRLMDHSDTDYEQVMALYNLKGHIASVPRFAEPQTSRIPVTNGSEDYASGNPTGRHLLHRWYQQVHIATRQRFVMLKHALLAS